jgi:hypothetical protein
VAQNYKELGINKMVAGFFRNNDKLGYVLLPVAAVFVWAFSLILPPFHQVSEVKTSFIYSVFLNGGSVNLFLGLNLLFSIANGYLISFVCTKHEISDKQNLLPGFFFILFTGLLNLSGAFHPIIPASTIVLIALFRLFSIYREEMSLSEVFDASFLLSLAVLVYAPFIVFVSIPFIAMLILKPFKLREWLLSLLGLLAPLILASALLFMGNRDYLYYWQIIRESIIPIHAFSFGKGTFLIHTAAVLCFFLSIIYMLGRSNSQKIKTQKVKYVLLWMFVLGFLSIFVMAEAQFFMGALVLIQLSIFIGDYIGGTKKNGLREFLTLLILVAYVCSNLQAVGYL